MVNIKPAIDTVIDNFGVAVTITNFTTPTYDEDEGWTEVSSGTTSVTIIPWDLFKHNRILESIGINNLGDVDFACKGDATINQNAQFTYLTKTYRVDAVNPLPFATDSNGNSIVVAQIITASEVMQ